MIKANRRYLARQLVMVGDQPIYGVGCRTPSWNQVSQ